MLGYIVDFACLKASLAIEIDGEQHGLAAGLRYDAVRDAKLAHVGIRTLRFWNHEVLSNIDGVVETIIVEVKRPPAHLSTLHTSGSSPG